MNSVHKPPIVPELRHEVSVFLAGTIDNGNSVDWQAKLTSDLSDLSIDILNPRRDNWDPTLEQSASNPVFRAQVEWELDALADTAGIIFMYFAPGSLSPITLLELGLHAGDLPIVVCPEGFWRKGNVDIVGEQYGFPVFNTLEDGIAALRTAIGDIL